MRFLTLVATAGSPTRRGVDINIAEIVQREAERLAKV
jgi:hypothetical protein